MTCARTLYDVKGLVYDTQDYEDYLSAISTTGLQQILIHKDGLTLDTKAENAEFTELNGTRYTDGERIPLRQIGTLKFKKNFDSSLIDNHRELIKAGLGNILGGSATTLTITADTGTGAVLTPFKASAVTNLANGNLVYIPLNGFRRVTSVDPGNTTFTVDVPTKQTSTQIKTGMTPVPTDLTFSVYNPVDITNPIGNCEKTFNFVLSLADGSYVKMMGCGITCAFAPVYEKQLTIEFTITSPSVTILSSAPAGFTTATAENKGTPVICNFSSSFVTDEDGLMNAYFLPNFDLGYSVASEPMKTIGGLNNVMGYMSRSSIKPKATFDRVADCKAWVAASRTSRVYSFYQSNFGIYLAGAKMTLIDQSIANGNHDSIQVELDANYDKDLRVYIAMP